MVKKEIILINKRITLQTSCVSSTKIVNLVMMCEQPFHNHFIYIRRRRKKHFKLLKTTRNFIKPFTIIIYENTHDLLFH